MDLEKRQQRRWEAAAAEGRRYLRRVAREGGEGDGDGDGREAGLGFAGLFIHVRIDLSHWIGDGRSVEVGL